MRKKLVLDFQLIDYERKSPILRCYCDHPLCNGYYIQCKPDQVTCWWTYLEKVDSKLLTD